MAGDCREEEQFLVDKFLNYAAPHPGGLWIGLHRDRKGNWRWASGKRRVGFTHWGAFQPDNTNDRENGVEIVGPGLPLAGKWNDFPDDPAPELRKLCYGIVEVTPRR